MLDLSETDAQLRLTSLVNGHWHHGRTFLYKATDMEAKKDWGAKDKLMNGPCITMKN
jgi:hypothetical protein